ncbi:retrovirus-related pol polyprotein from transposon TNT 1-94 [Tanacetum coccineum]|uniref:Retrovirus-related pol polyprotein from transposon TNT 1-94 n=1 Tax=Tanacetum coccineum TaxID=301880 RepID=A0ABQ5HUU8_9ASTR
MVIGQEDARPQTSSSAAQTSSQNNDSHVSARMDQLQNQLNQVLLMLQNNQGNVSQGFQNPFYLKKAQQLEPKLYDGNVIKNTSAIVIPDSEETLMLAEESRSKMLLKQKDPMMLEKKVNTTPVNYANSMNSPDPTLSSRPTKVEVPKELPKVSMVNTSLKKLKHHFDGFDVVVKERTTTTTITEGSWGFKHTKACFMDELIPFVKALKDLFNTFDQYLIDELSKVKNIFHQMEQAVEQHRLESKTFEVKMNQVLNENERLLEQVINKDIVNIIMNSSVDNASVNVHECEKCLKLETELLNKEDFIEKEIYDKLFKSFTTLEKHCISLEVDTQLNQEIFQKDNSVSNQSDPSFDQSLKDELRKLKGKALVDNAVTKHTIDPEMLKNDVEPITPKLLNNRTAHSAYIKHTQEEAAVLRDLVEHVKANYPLDHPLESALVVTPKNKDKNTKTASSSNLVSNKPMLSSTGIKPSTSASGSQPSGNTKKDKIQQTPSSTQKNKVEAHPRKVKSSLKNKDCVVAPKGTANVQHSKLNANSELKCVKCNGCMLSDNHDLCVLDFINNVNARVKSKSAKKNSKRKVWKPTGKVFTNIGYIWRPTGRTFTIVGNACPLTRITTTTEVPLRKPTALENETPKPVVTLVYSRKPRKSKTNVPVSKSKVVQIVLWYLDSGCSKHMTGDRSQLTNFVNKFLGTVKFKNDHVADILGYGDYQIGNVMISRVYYVEGLGHNLFSVGQFYDSNLEVAFRQHTCFICNLEGVDLLTGSRGNNLYTLSLRDMMASSPICLLSKASKTKIDNGTKFVNQTLREYYEKVDISHETYVARSPQQNGFVERRNRTLIKAARTMLICVKAPLFLWTEAVATACYTQNCSIIRLRHDKTPYELLHDKPPDLSFFHVFGALCYPTNDSENLGKLQPKADIGIFIGYAPTKKAFRIYNRRTRRIIEIVHVDFDELTAMASEHCSSGPALHEMTPATISLGLMPNPPPSTPVDCPAPRVSAPITKVVALELTASTGSPSSTTVDQDAPSPSNSQTTPETQSPVIPNDVKEDNHDLDIAHMDNDLYFGITIPEVPFNQSSSTNSIHTIVHPDHQIFEHNSKWTKDHPLQNIIGELARPVSTRLQLHEQALFCYYDAFLTAVEPKPYEGIFWLFLKKHSLFFLWIEAMQEELNEFEHLEVWELVPRLDKVMVITLKWIYKVKLDELGGFPNQVYKLKKALYGLKQALRAWYDLLSLFLISQDFSKGSVDPTMFICKEGKKLLLVQIYVDDIIFAASTPKLCDLFAKIMCSKFKMSMMGKISFFLGLQISQSPKGIFINQSKYALESLKKYGFDSCDPVDTPMREKSKLDKDTKGKAIDPSHYRGMIGTLLYLTASRPDLQFAICMCARYQAWPTEKHLQAVKRIFRYLRGTANRGL